MRKIFYNLILVSVLSACSFNGVTAFEMTPAVPPLNTSTLTVAYTPSRISTVTPIPPTLTIVPSATPTLTPAEQIMYGPSRVLGPIRPVDSKYPIYHAYGVPVAQDPGHNGHNGYDYDLDPLGINSCRKIDIHAVESGIVAYTITGVVWIYHGKANLADGRTVNIVTQYGHINPNPELHVGDYVDRGDVIAFSGQTLCGELEIQVFQASLDAPTNDMRFLIDWIEKHPNIGNKTEHPHIDPALIGLPPE